MVVFEMERNENDRQTERKVHCLTVEVVGFVVKTRLVVVMVERWERIEGRLLLLPSEDALQ